MSGRRALVWAGRSVVGLTSVAVLGAIGFGWFTYRTAVDGIVTDDVIEAAPAAPGATSTPDLPRTAMTILLVGLDSRTDAQGNPLPQEVLDALRAGEATSEQNTDTMMVVHVPADPAKQAFAVSLPRDSYVDIAGGFGTHKLNSAYARAKAAKASELRSSGADESTVERESTTAGRKNLIATVSELTGLHVYHYAEINLFGFSEITKAVGGVPVCLTEPVDDSYSGAHFPAGPQVLKGVDALKFVRQRHGLPGGDLDRVRRQQAFLAGLANRLFSAGTLADPARLTSLVEALSKAVVLDKNWDLLAFAQQVAGLTGDRIEFSTIPTIRPDLATPYDGSAVEVDPAQVRAFVQDLLHGAPAGTGTDRPPDPGKADQPARTPPGLSPGRSGQVEIRVKPGTTAPMGHMASTGQTADQPIDAGGVPCVN
ncbi:LCP family protein [Actinophytocola sp.]|uniref:LCP family protein n=1 Tax=Actinophytocola sp. TaxID=1872138 RepID=UPI0025C67D21|nr:LCP family protein [Actinophytocola sp.]